VAKSIYARAAANGKRVQALGGAKNHLVVMPDADVSAAADALASAAFGAAGQRCMAITVAVAVGHIADALVEELANRAQHISLDAGNAKGADIGPVISASAQKRVRDFVSEAINQGAVAVIDRSQEQPADHPFGYFVGPTVLDHVNTSMDVYRAEVFGPVLSVLRVDNLDQAIELIDTNPYGNGSAIFTNSGHAARTFQRRVTTGAVGVNVPIPLPVAVFGFAGWKDSSFGDTGIADSSWRFYTRAKFTVSRWESAPAGIDLGFRPN
jgi:malonate-semialdehyde dehydrogenase (acetylating) / methylmalonate-semialdehyde dehydrogenase